MLTGEVANLECTKLISVTGKITYRHGVANNSGHTGTTSFFVILILKIRSLRCFLLEEISALFEYCFV